jgi:hypothetical protein
MFASPLDLARRKLLLESVGSSTVLIGIGEGAHPVELRFADELAELFEFLFGFSGEAHDERRTQSQIRDRPAHFGDRTEEDLGSASALHALQH